MNGAVIDMTRRITERDLERALGRIRMLNDLVCEATQQLAQHGPTRARALRHRASAAAYTDHRGPTGAAW
jgi:hypothetical protein